MIDLVLPTGNTSAHLDIKVDSRGTVNVANTHEQTVTCKEELLGVVHAGQKRRQSSASHLIFTVIVETTNRKTKQVAMGKLLFGDLASPERVKIQPSGVQMKDPQSADKSLVALGEVLDALAKNAKHVPYRNDKLTMLLNDSIGGNAKTLVFVNCSPDYDSLDETSAALYYAARFKMIVNKLEKNQDSIEVARLKKVIQCMSRELEQNNSSRLRRQRSDIQMESIPVPSVTNVNLHSFNT